jgi:2,3-bisphosphoglycerate-dependent phosphoglycerate mutase
VHRIKHEAQDFPVPPPKRLILIRHGESEWNRDNRFTGWADVGLTPGGTEQMRAAARLLRDAGISVDAAYSSVLSRCILSLWIVLEELDCPWVSQILDWRLNERHYGGLTGLVKSEAEARFGHAAVLGWRRGYDTQPPPLDDEAAAYIAIDRRYAGLSADAVPLGESLEQTVTRVQDVWLQSMIPALRNAHSLLVVGHGNSLRALIKILEGVSDDDVVSLEVDNAVPIVYELDSALAVRKKSVFADTPTQRSEIL